MKKIGKRQIILISVAAVLVLAIGITAVVLVLRNIGAGRENERNAYIGLMFLKNGDSELSQEYFDSVADNAGNGVRFAVDCAEVIRQQIIGNKTLSNVGIDLLNRYDLDESRASIVTFLSSGTGGTSGYGGVIDQIVRSMNIPDNRRSEYDEQFNIERMAYSTGYLPEEAAESYKKMRGDDALDSLVLCTSLSNGSYNTAFEKAVDMVKNDPSDSNRMLLADIIADAAYNGATLNTEYLYNAAGKKYDPEVVAAESAAVDAELYELEGSIFDLEVRIQNTEDGSQKADMQDQLEKLYENRKMLGIKKNYPMLYRAFNSIATIPSVEASIVSAKLCYAAGMKDEAIKRLTGAAGSFRKSFCKSSTVIRGLDVIDDLYNGGGRSKADASAVTAVNRMINTATEYLYVVRRGGYADRLSTEFASELLDKFKYQDNDIYITSVDDSEYPKLSVTVNGREAVLNDFLNKKKVRVRDTGYDVDFEVILDERAISSICFVVDISGSMGGEPIDNAKKALRTFIQTMNDTTEVSIVAFDNSAYERTTLTTDKNTLLNGVETLSAAGGTNIAAGIVGGIESLKKAAGAKNIILMTDGQSDENYSWLSEALSGGVTIFTVGFGSVNTNYLTEIAEQTGGTFTLADSSGDLENVYSSIGAVIGHQIRITYTVSENVDETPRYIFVRSENYNASQVREYRTGSGDSNSSTTADTFVLYDSLYYPKSEMEEYDDENRKVHASLDTSDNDEVESLEIDGQKITPEPDKNLVEFDIMPLDEGLYDIKFNFKDGSSYTSDDAILVYDDAQDSKTKTYRYEDVRIGAVIISADLIVVTPDRTVIMCGVRMHNADRDGYSWSLDARTENFLIFENVAVSDKKDSDGNLYWGESADFVMDGVLILSSDDAQNSYGNKTISSKGKLSGSIDSEQCEISSRSGD